MRKYGHNGLHVVGWNDLLLFRKKNFHPLEPNKLKDSSEEKYPKITRQPRQDCEANQKLDREVRLPTLRIVSFDHNKMADLSSANVWVLAVSSSRYWFNYRHTSDSLLFASIARRFGVPEEKIISLDSVAPDKSLRNVNREKFYASEEHVLDHTTKFGAVDIDYSGEQVTLELTRDLLTLSSDEFLTKYGNQAPFLDSNANSNVLIYLSGHGGDGFFKFQDYEELDAEDLASIISLMHHAGKYRQLVLIADTCQAATLSAYITAPNVTVLTSSLRDENSYALHTHPTLGLPVIDRYTYAMNQFMESNYFRYFDHDQQVPKKNRKITWTDFHQSLSFSYMQSHPYIHQTEGAEPMIWLSFRMKEQQLLQQKQQQLTHDNQSNHSDQALPLSTLFHVKEEAVESIPIDIFYDENILTPRYMSSHKIDQGNVYWKEANMVGELYDRFSVVLLVLIILTLVSSIRKILSR